MHARHSFSLRGSFDFYKIQLTPCKSVRWNIALVLQSAKHVENTTNHNEIISKLRITFDKCKVLCIAFCNTLIGIVYACNEIFITRILVTLFIRVNIGEKNSTEFQEDFGILGRKYRNAHKFSN